MRQFSIDAHSVSIVAASGAERPLGSGFFFMDPTLFVTARHVVFHDGVPRQNLYLIHPGYPSLTLLFYDPDIDIAVLRAISSTCQAPLEPSADTDLSGGLWYCGYAPSVTAGLGQLLGVVPNYASSVEVEERVRDSGVEVTYTFQGRSSEGGYSGGPVFAATGGVIGVVIENVSATGVARATSISPATRFISRGG